MPNDSKHGYRRPKSSKIADYLRKKLNEKGLTVDELAKSVKIDEKARTPKTVVVELFNSDSIPTYYGYFKKICELLEVEDSVISEWEKTEPAYIFSYWNWIKPNAPKIEQIGLLIRKHNKDFTREELGKYFSTSFVSHTEYLAQVVSYDTFCKYAMIYGISELELLKEFEEDTELHDNLADLSSYIRNGRKELGKSEEDVVNHIHNVNDKFRLDVDRYKKLENATTKYFLEEIQNLSMALNLSAQTLFEKVDKCGLYASSDTFKEAIKKGHLADGERRVTDICNMLSNYKYVKTDNQKVETHTLSTLFLLILLSGNTEKYRVEIMYYLSYLTKKGNLPNSFIHDNKNLSNFEYFELIRKQNKVSCRQLGLEVGKSNAYAIDFCQGKGVLSPVVAMGMSDKAGISPAILLEGYLQKTEPSREYIPENYIISTIQFSIMWNLDGFKVETNTFAEVIRIIFNQDLSVEDKYSSLKNLKYEDVFI